MEDNKLIFHVDIKGDTVTLSSKEYRSICEACRNLNEINDNLTARIRHLLQSDYIRSFDEKEHGEYKRDIKDADKQQGKLLYLCDRRRCEACRECGYTTDISHAKNFKQIGGMYVEQESGGDVFITNNYFGKQEIEEASK